MQTRFTPKQLRDPAIAASEQVLRKCVHCGFCTATCPTYVLLGDELDSPRGRIYLIKDMLEHGRPATAEVVKHLDRCLSCLACMTTCPSGVNYQHLIDHARSHVEQTYRRPPADRFVRSLLAAIMPRPGRFRFALRLASWLRPLAPVLPTRLKAMLELVPRRLPRRVDQNTINKVNPASNEKGDQARAMAFGRVGVLTGCVQSVVGSSINAATFRLLERAGIEVVPVTGCCGSIVHHLGRDADGRGYAAALVEQIHVEMQSGGLDAVVVNASGCGTHLKDYGFLFRNELALADKAETVSRMTRDITEVISEVGLPDIVVRPELKVAYHSACSMQHGQQLEGAPRELLSAAGFEVIEVPEGHLCCGSAGSYNMLQPEIAGKLRQRKLANIALTGADLVAAGNLGCMTQLGSTARSETAAGTASAVAQDPRPVVHTVELLDWVTGGEKPDALSRR